MAKVPDALSIAMGHHRAGRLREAEEIYRQILQAEPGYAQVWYLLGGLAYQTGNSTVALQLIGRAAELAPESVDYQYELGLLLEEQKRLDEAAACYGRALELNPALHEVRIKLAGVLQNLKNWNEAAEQCRRLVKLQPHLADAHDRLGIVLQQLGETDEAVACHRRAIELQPSFAEAHFSLGNAFSAQEELKGAIASYRRALELRPEYVEALCNLGNALHTQWRLPESIRCHRRAIELRPDFAEAHYNLGNALKGQGNVVEATTCYRRALQLRPQFADAVNSLGAALRDQCLVDEAMQCFRQALELNPNYPEAYCNLGTGFRDLAQLDEAIACYGKALKLKRSFPRAHSNLVYTLCFSATQNAPAIWAEHRRWNEHYAKALHPSLPMHANVRVPNRRLKIGYLSPDFRDHVLALFLSPLLLAHDHQQFSIFCYSDVVCPDQITAQMHASADVWREISALGDEQVAELVREDQIDILVDLTMHMERNRLLVFARKPAPVQVTWLAYPGTTGLTAIDYRLTDPYLDPPGMFDQFYSEESVRLADTFWCYDPLTTEPAVNALPALKNGYITFGGLNNFCKVNDGVLKLWARVLSAVERSRLVLLAPEGSCRQRVIDIFKQVGTPSDRIEFVGRQPRARYLEVYHQIDIGLDTFPYNGHTTSLDSLWMGVPVVTRVGQTVVGRAGLSQLTNLNLTDLIAHTADQFVQIATDLAADLPRLAALRADLRPRMQRSPLMDAPRFARSIESAYRTIWHRWCNSKM